MAISTIFSCAYFKVCKLAIPFALSPVHLKCMPGLKYEGVLFHSTVSLLYSIVLKGLTTLLNKGGHFTSIVTCQETSNFLPVLDTLGDVIFK